LLAGPCFRDDSKHHCFECEVRVGRVREGLHRKGERQLHLVFIEGQLLHAMLDLGLQQFLETLQMWFQ